MAVTHTAFGLVLRSNLPIPGLTISQANGPANIEIQVGMPPSLRSEGREETGFFESRQLAESGEPILRICKLVKSQLFHFTYYDGVQFWLNHEGSRVWATWPECLTIEGMATYFVSPVLGFMLRLRGLTCLHASAVAFENRAVVFVGPAGSGKSTAAATMGKAGYAVLADDIVSVTERDSNLYVMPALPFLSLWPESVDMLYGSPESLPRFIPDWGKRRLSLEDGEVQFQRKPLALGAIYLFGDRIDAREPHIAEIPPRKALIDLVVNTYAATLLDRELRAREFEILGRLVANSPVRRLLLPRIAGRPGQLCELICQDCRSLSKQTPSRSISF